MDDKKHITDVAVIEGVIIGNTFYDLTKPLEIQINNKPLPFVKLEVREDADTSCEESEDLK